MTSNRLEAFSDGVLAIIITIMVLELEPPISYSKNAILEVLPYFFGYFISFIYIGSYWNHHHHLFKYAKQINGKVLWGNLIFLFFTSLIPYATSWLNDNFEDSIALSFYGIILLFTALSFLVLHYLVLNAGEEKRTFKELLKVIGNKGEISLLIYIVGICLSFYVQILSILCYIVVLVLWLIPNKKIEKQISHV
ncbi:TMEM175 family protein [Maribacter ulvicola]|uniref:Uncharacterized membrane protein n=1 Tax=Maribacter ulvicola TaxID=228959 RepID=A0A1N6QSU7_9FLAO|nr:TMEM175 family protein [Maribacter ulvicola]SIQ19618.1 Uncharacterized membrane protein [Maribacter ulvicola]